MDRTSLKAILWGLILSILLMGGCATTEQPVSTPETPGSPSQPVDTVSHPQRTDPGPPPESSKPPESPPPSSQVVEKTLPQPEIMVRVLPQPEVTRDIPPEPQGGEKPEPPLFEKTEKASSEDVKLLSPSLDHDARIIQARLADLGFYEGPIDGIWGRGSRTALMAFKEENALGSSDKWDKEIQMILFRQPVQPDRITSDSNQKPISSGSVLLNPSVPQDAKKIQARLADVGLYEGAIDGMWGKGSRSGLRSFKQEQSLKNPDTWDKETQMLLFRGTNQ